ncbi:hypothetical protein KM043_006276 [Ampulex compressa]|nr:hypothetical protein KM043_006276 [Ampulex compressa]
MEEETPEEMSDDRRMRSLVGGGVFEARSTTPTRRHSDRNREERKEIEVDPRDGLEGRQRRGKLRIERDLGGGPRGARSRSKDGVGQEASRRKVDRGEKCKRRPRRFAARRLLEPGEMEEDTTALGSSIPARKISWMPECGLP